MGMSLFISKAATEKEVMVTMDGRTYRCFVTDAEVKYNGVNNMRGRLNLYISGDEIAKD